MPEIQESLRKLVSDWKDFSGTEKGWSQTFLNQLIGAYTGSPDVMEAGARFEEFGSRDDGSGFMDLYWPEIAIVEMKSPNQSRRLDQHRAQAIDYWRNSSDVEKQIAAPPHLVLCSFHQFEIWEPGRFPTKPVDTFSLEELPDHAESLLFFAGNSPVYGGAGAAVTREAAQHMVSLYFSLLERDAVPAEELRRFIVQTVWALFAEDIGIIEGRPIETIVRALVKDPSRNSAVELADLYRRLNTQDPEKRNRGRATPLPYVNGDLFEEPAEVDLRPDELAHLLVAAEFDWRRLYPTIFGSLLEGCLGHNLRWELGAHYTSEEDIMTIVDPVIVRPWVERIESVTTHKGALKLLDELCKFKVLDPAMGCGNFLAVAYREIKSLEHRLHERIGELAYNEGKQPSMELGLYPISNIQGIEIEPVAVAIARTTLWMTHAIESRRFKNGDQVLPLPSLKNLVCADSLKTPWPSTDCVIGNPPFHGDRNLRSVVGDDYIDWLKSEFGVGVKDHCVYFFLKAHRELRPGNRAGLVSTNTISQGKNRDSSLLVITENGGVITDAVSTQIWSGEAKVHVSITCWIKDSKYSGPFTLNHLSVEGITPSLTAGTSHQATAVLPPNRKVCFQGFLTRGMGFVLNPTEAASLLAAEDESYRDVIVPYINGEDTVRRIDQDPSRWVIDFASMPLEKAQQKYPVALEILRERVLPERLNDPEQLKRWWQFWNVREGLRSAIAPLDRFAVASRVGKRLLLIWAKPDWRPSDACNVFAFADDYWFGVCSSTPHSEWAWATSSTMKGDLRYSPKNVFETFPFPNPNDKQREAIADAARSIVELRRRYCNELQVGLTALYNLVDEGGAVELAEAHLELDNAVLDAYGWSHDLLANPDKLLMHLFELNAAYAKDSSYDPFGKLQQEVGDKLNFE